VWRQDEGGHRWVGTSNSGIEEELFGKEKPITHNNLSWGGSALVKDEFYLFGNAAGDLHWGEERGRPTLLSDVPLERK